MLLCAFGLIGCAEGASGLSSQDPPGPAVGDRFTLGVEQSVTVADTGIRVTYAELVDDSRCPPEVTCVWEGDAVVAVALSGGPESTTTELHTYDQRPSSAGYGDYRIELVDLNRDGTQATFVVTR